MVIKGKVFCPNCGHDNFIVQADTSGEIEIKCTSCLEILGDTKSKYITEATVGTEPAATEENDNADG